MSDPAGLYEVAPITLADYGIEGPTGLATKKSPVAHGLDPEFYLRLGKAFRAMHEDGLGRPGVKEGYRSIESQRELKAQEARGTRPQGITANPGESLHGVTSEDGEPAALAGDFDFNEQQATWMRVRGPEFGVFVPTAKEPWHVQLMPEFYAGAQR